MPYSSFDIWGGDRGFMRLNIEAFHADLWSCPRGRQWMVYKNFKPLLSPQMQQDHDMFAQPPWALLITNGLDDIYLHENANKPYIQVRSKKTPLTSRLELSPTQAEEIGARLLEEFASGDMTLTPLKPNAHIKPVGIRYKYSANKSSLQSVHKQDPQKTPTVKAPQVKYKPTAEERRARKERIAAQQKPKKAKRPKPFQTKQQKLQAARLAKKDKPTTT